MRKIKIAILDSGIADELLSTVAVTEKKQFYYDYYSDEIIENDKATDYNGHGTSCVDTILSICPDVEFAVIKILGISGLTEYEVLIKALEYAGGIGADIIALCSSLVTDEHDDRLRNICKELSERGIIIVASVQNYSQTSAPADYDGVIGVIGGFMAADEYRYDETRKIQMQCSTDETVARGVHGIRTVFQGNSRAAAAAAGIIAGIIRNDENAVSDISGALKENSFSAEFTDEKSSSEYDELIAVPFDRERELFYIENDENYHRFIYLLCEFFFSEDTDEIRMAYLPDFKGRHFLREIGCLLELIEERFGPIKECVRIGDCQWAYQFYEKYIRR